MNIPVLGPVTIQGIVLFAVWGGFCVYGFLAGFKRTSHQLTACLIAITLAVIPAINSFIADLISVVISNKANHVAHLLVFVSVYVALRFLLYRLPQMVPLQHSVANKILGAAAGAVQGFVHSSMLLIFIYTVRLPINGLYANSEIAKFLARIWSELGLLKVLYLPQYLNPLNWL